MSRARRLTRAVGVVVAMMAGLGVVLPAQTFRSSVDAVTVDVLVTRRGQPVTDLTAADFTLRDNGVEQRIESLELDEVPITLLLVLDVSGSVGGAGLGQLRAAAREAGEALRPDDRVGLVTFSDRVRLGLDPASAAEELPAALARVRAGGATALYDATFTGLTLRERTGDRTVMLVFSDGDDTASWLDPRDVLGVARRSDVVVYGVAVDRGQTDSFVDQARLSRIREWFPQEPEIFRQAYLHWLVSDTGGSLQVSSDLGRLREMFAQVVSEFRSRYVLTYSPRGVSETGWHALEVAVEGRGLQVTARRGYLR